MWHVTPVNADLTGRRVSRGPQGHRFHPLVQPPQAAVTSAAHPPPRSPDRLRSGERSASAAPLCGVGCMPLLGAPRLTVQVLAHNRTPHA